MKKVLFLACSLLIFKGQLIAQNVTVFDLPQPSVSGFTSVYHTIQVVDSRVDTSHFGYLSRLNESLKPVVMRPDIQTQLASYASAEGEAAFLLNLRWMEFSLVTKVLTEDAYCKYQADYYVKNGIGYRLVQKVDTIFEIKKETRDIKQKIKDLVGSGIMNTLRPHLTSIPSAVEAAYPLYTLRDIRHTDSMEKRQIPFYAASVLKDGVYRSAKSLYLQQPDDSLNAEKIKIRDNRLVSYQYWDSTKETWRTGIFTYSFAVTHKGVPYIFHQGQQPDFIKMERRGQDYYYYGKIPEMSFATTISPTFGLAGFLAGAAVDAARDKGPQLFRLDYLSQRAVLAGPIVNNKRK